MLLPVDFQELLNESKQFIRLILEEIHAKTASFFVQYVNFMNMYFRFSRSERTGNFGIYVESLSEMALTYFCFQPKKII